VGEGREGKGTCRWVLLLWILDTPLNIGAYSVPRPLSWIKGSLLRREEMWEGSGGGKGRERDVWRGPPFMDPRYVPE